MPVSCGVRGGAWLPMNGRLGGASSWSPPGSRSWAPKAPPPGGIAVISPWADLDPVSRAPVPEPYLSANRVAATDVDHHRRTRLPPRRQRIAGPPARDAGVPVESVSWPGQAHAFPLVRSLPESAVPVRTAGSGSANSRDVDALTRLKKTSQRSCIAASKELKTLMAELAGFA